MTAEQKKKEVVETVRFFKDNPDNWFADRLLIDSDVSNYIENSKKEFLIFVSPLKYIPNVRKSSLNWLMEFVANEELTPQQKDVMRALANGERLSLSLHNFTGQARWDELTQYVSDTINIVWSKSIICEK